MGSSTPGRRRARPLADTPAQALAARADDLAKAWLLALVEERPLVGAAAIRIEELAVAGPQICVAMVAAIGSDRELDRIARGGERHGLVSRVGELAGSGPAAETSRAVEALRAVLWTALLRELEDPHAGAVADFAERLAVVAETVREAALSRPRGGSASGEQQVTEWPGQLEAAVAAARGRGAPLSLLLAELEDAGRVLAIEPSQDAAELLERFASVVRSVIGPEHLVAGEEPGRVWVIAPGTDGEDAAELASSLAAAVAGEGPWRGAPLRAMVGVATLDRDGSDAVGLIEAAEEAAFVAAASGIEVSRGSGMDPD